MSIKGGPSLAATNLQATLGKKVSTLPTTYDLEHFGLREMIESSRAIRSLGMKSQSMEEAAREVVDFVYDSFFTSTGRPACVLVRCFKTHRFGDLPPSLKRVASATAGPNVTETTPCLSLLATRGARAEWNSRHTSNGHQAIPLTSPEMIARAPMIARLMQEMGIRTQDVLQTDAVSPGKLDRKTLEVFYVPEAEGSEFIPAQLEFVKPHGVRSVLSFGGVLPDGAFFFIIMFTAIPLTAGAAEMFRTFALGFKLVMLAQGDKPVFTG